MTPHEPNEQDNAPGMNSWQTVVGRVAPGHRVASGQNEDPRYPGGTLHMQERHFRERGLDLAAYHPGTLNVSLAPHGYRVVKPRMTFYGVKWVHPGSDGKLGCGSGREAG